MVLRLTVVLICISFPYSLAFAEGCTAGESTSNPALAQKIISTDSSNTDLIKQASEYLTENQSDLCMRYYFGRYLTRLERYGQSRTVLAGLENELARSGNTNVSPENVIGFGFLSEGNNDSALEAFQNAAQVSYFDNFPNDLKTKILNNLGYAQMQVGRYDEASETLKQAAELGSSRAFRNLAAVASIVSTLEESDTSQPGAFAAIVGSAKSLSTAESSLLQISHKLNVEQSNISVFRMNNGRYSISLGRFKSYPAAISDRDKAVEAGISDSYVAWLTDWELIETTMRE